MTEQHSKDTEGNHKGWIDNAADPLQTEDDVKELERMIEAEKNKKMEKDRK